MLHLSAHRHFPQRYLSVWTRSSARSIQYPAIDVPEKRCWNIADPFSGNKIGITGWQWGKPGLPIALLHHANGFCAPLWTLVAEKMCKQYQVVAIDARGHGDSDSPEAPGGYDWGYFVSDLTCVAQLLLDETAQNSIAYGIGNSFGGIVTAVAEARSPGLFRKISMLDPPIYPEPSIRKNLGLEPSADGIGRRNHLVEITQRRRSQWPSRETARKTWVDKPMFSSWDPRAFELYLKEGLRDRGTEVELKCHPNVEASIFKGTGSFDLFSLAPSIDIPVLMVHAANGNMSKPAYEHLARLLPDCTLLTAPVGHLMPMEAPGLTVEILEEFSSTN